MEEAMRPALLSAQTWPASKRSQRARSAGAATWSRIVFARLNRIARGQNPRIKQERRCVGHIGILENVTSLRFRLGLIV